METIIRDSFYVWIISSFYMHLELKTVNKADLIPLILNLKANNMQLSAIEALIQA